jgi:hypothetical protein
VCGLSTITAFDDIDDLTLALTKGGIWRGVEVHTYVDYNDLFPVCEFVVCHGGASSVQHALAHRCPVIAAPQMGDQFWWANRLEELKIGAMLLSTEVSDIELAIVTADSCVVHSELAFDCRPNLDRTMSVLFSEFLIREPAPVSGLGTLVLKRGNTHAHPAWQGRAKGLHKTKVTTVVTTFSPDVAGFCVRECIAYINDTYNASKLNLMHVARFKPFSKMSGTDDLLQLSMLLRINFNISFGSEGLYMNVGSDKEVGLSIVAAGNMLHCEVAKIELSDVHLLPNKQCLPSAREEVLKGLPGNHVRAIETIMSPGRSSHKALGSALTTLFTGTEADLRAKYNSSALWYTAEQMKNPTITVPVAVTRYGYQVLTRTGLTDGSLVLIPSAGPFIYGLVKDTSEGMIVLCQSCMAVSSLLLVKTRLGPQTARKELLGAAEQSNTGFLNNASKSIYTEAEQYGYNWPVRSDLDLTVVCRYDNRDHHKFSRTRIEHDKVKYYPIPVSRSFTNSMNTSTKPFRLCYNLGPTVSVRAEPKAIKYFASIFEGSLSIIRESDSLEITGTKEQELAIIGISSKGNEYLSDGDRYPTYSGPQGEVRLQHSGELTTLFGASLAVVNEFLSRNGLRPDEPFVVSVSPYDWLPDEFFCGVGPVYCKEATIYVRSNFVTISALNPRAGSGLTATEAIKMNNITQWWQHRREPMVKFTRKLWSLDTIETLELSKLEKVSDAVTTLSFSEKSLPTTVYHMASNSGISPSLACHVEEPTAEIVSMFTDLDLSDRIVKYLPKTPGPFKSSEEASRTMVTQKTMMVQYPVWSRPVLHKMVNAEFNAVSRRLAHKLLVRKEDLSPPYEVRKMLDTFCVLNWKELATGMIAEPLTFDYQDIYDWLVERPDGIKIEKELDQIMTMGIDTFALNYVKVHVKLESLLKEEPISHMHEQKQRIIVWQVKGVTVMFSALFKRAKERLKSILKPHVTYTDGKTPEELDRFVSSVMVEPNGWFVEDDLTQQDKQTDMQNIHVEMAVYKQLGVSQDVLESWLRVHRNWRAKGTYLTFIGDGMRLSGQATTALGNAVNNMACHWRFCSRLGDRLKMVCILGDDNIYYVQDKPDTDRLNRETAVYYNMFSTATHRKTVGQFCSLLIYESNSGSLRVCPDLVRLRRRFEVTNGVARSGTNNLDMRRWSYGMMYGSSDMLDDVAKKENWPVDLPNWYDRSEAVAATAALNGVDEEFVMSSAAMLEQMIANPSPVHVEFLVSSVSRK